MSELRFSLRTSLGIVVSGEARMPWKSEIAKPTRTLPTSIANLRPVRKD